MGKNDFLRQFEGRKSWLEIIPIISLTTLYPVGGVI